MAIEQKEQELFDTLLAHAVETIHTEGFTEKLLGMIDERQASIGLQLAAKVIVDRLTASAKKIGKKIPDKMMPDLVSQIVGQIVEAAEAAGIKISQQDAIAAAKMLLEEHIKQGVQGGGQGQGQQQGPQGPQAQRPQQQQQRPGPGGDQGAGRQPQKGLLQ